jgi:hypothetical protein
MEQGGYIEGDEQGTYGYGGGGGDFNLSMGGGGDDYSIDLGGGGFDFGDADFFYGYGFDTGAEYGDSGYQSGGDLYGAYVDYYTESGLDLMTAMELAAQDVAAGSIETITSEHGLLPDALGPETFYGLPYIPDSFLTPYTPIFPDLPPPLPPTVTPNIPLTVAQPPQTPLPQTPTTGQQPMAPGLPPACPTGQYHPFPLGHPDQNKCIPFPPAQTGSKPGTQQSPQAKASTGGSSGGAQQQPKCPTGYFLDPATKQCKPIPQGQPQSCPTGYYRASTGQCLPIPKCTTPGTVFDQARGLCVPKGTAISPLPEGVEGLFDELSKLPWWIWLALGGLLLLSRDGEDGKKTTVTYRRAR